MFKSFWNIVKSGLVLVNLHLRMKNSTKVAQIITVTLRVWLVVLPHQWASKGQAADQPAALLYCFWLVGVLMTPYQPT